MIHVCTIYFIPYKFVMLPSERFQDRQRPVGVYQSLLSPPTSICDVTYWLNHLAQERRNERNGGEKIAAINTAGKLLQYIHLLLQVNHFHQRNQVSLVYCHL